VIPRGRFRSGNAPTDGAADIRAQLFAPFAHEDDGELIAVQCLKAAIQNSKSSLSAGPAGMRSRGARSNLRHTGGLVIGAPDELRVELTVMAKMPRTWRCPEQWTDGTRPSSGGCRHGCEHWTLGVLAGFAG